MKTILIGSLAAATLALTTSALHAAPLSYSFTVTIDGGSLVGQVFTGTFSFDTEGQVPQDGLNDEKLYELSSFAFSFVGGPFSKPDLDGARVAIDTGVFIGLDVADATYSFVPANGPFAAAFAYDLGNANFPNAGNGSIVYTLRTGVVPEPGTAWLAGAGLLAGLGGLRRRSAAARAG